MEKNNFKKFLGNRLTVEERDAVCALIVSRMLATDWNELSNDAQKDLVNALDKIRKFK